MIRYAVSMSIRVVCFILAVVVQNWLTWVFLTLAVVLPYIAVTLANAGTDRYLHGREEFTRPEAPRLTQGESRRTGAEDPPEPLQWWEDSAVFGEPAEPGPRLRQELEEPIEGELIRDEDPTPEPGPGAEPPPGSAGTDQDDEPPPASP